VGTIVTRYSAPLIDWRYDANLGGYRGGRWTAMDDGTLWLGTEFFGRYKAPCRMAQDVEALRVVERRRDRRGQRRAG